MRLKELSIDEMIRSMVSTEILVAAYGSEMIVALYMLPGSAVIEVMPPFWEDAQYRNYVMSLGLKHFPLRTMGEVSKICSKRPDSFECYTKGMRDRNMTLSLHDTMVMVWRAREAVLSDV
jgi:singapore isolate B (sub-type 7) whole genome shotgun sequence assembly, scaffold_23